MTLDTGVLGYRFDTTFWSLGYARRTTRDKNVGEKARGLASLVRGPAEVTA